MAAPTWVAVLALLFGMATMDSSFAARRDAAMAFFASQGWTHNQAAGIVGNLQAESGIDHTRAQMNGGPGYGLAQWEGPRQAMFKTWAGRDIRESTFDEQLRFIQFELTGPEIGAGRALKAAKSAGAAGAIVCRLYERPADTDGQAVYRCGLAEKIARETQFNNVIAGSESTA